MTHMRAQGATEDDRRDRGNYAGVNRDEQCVRLRDWSGTFGLEQPPWGPPFG